MPAATPAASMAGNGAKTSTSPWTLPPPQWSLDSLTKAYQQGYMAGLTGQSRLQQPYADEVPAAAWEAGWDDGFEQMRLQQHIA